MSYDDSDDKTQYYIVINDEEMYSIWPDHKEIPAGWKSVGEPQSKAECLAKIAELWTDMRPLSLRQRLDQADA